MRLVQIERRASEEERRAEEAAGSGEGFSRYRTHGGDARFQLHRACRSSAAQIGAFARSLAWRDIHICDHQVAGPGYARIVRPWQLRAGCCANGVCAIGIQDFACGLGGAACEDCTANNGLCAGAELGSVLQVPGA
jgi:hypothetical protein